VYSVNRLFVGDGVEDVEAARARSPLGADLPARWGDAGEDGELGSPRPTILECLGRIVLSTSSFARTVEASAGDGVLGMGTCKLCRLGDFIPKVLKLNTPVVGVFRLLLGRPDVAACF
jgi:hypothetical protein